MTNNDKPKEPRVWRLRYEYIPPDDGIENVEGPFTDGDVEVIEKSAYDALAEKLAEAEAESERLRKIIQSQPHTELTLARQQNQRLREALQFYAEGQHLNHKDYDEVELECEGSRMTDHVVGKHAREALETEGG